MIKASHKWLKVVLKLGVRNLGLASITSKLDEFLLFDNFFLNLAKFWDLDVFLIFDILDFLACFILLLLISNLLTSLLLSFLPKTSQLLLFLSRTSLSDNLVIFNIKVNRAIILLKLWINY